VSWRIARAEAQGHDRRVPRRVSSPIFVGRVAERAAIADALERAVAGRPGVVLIGGEAGVGKSRLLAEVAANAATLGATVVAGACVDVAAGTLPYAPFVEIISGLHRAGMLASLAPGTIAELGRLTPTLAVPGHELPVRGDGGQGRLFAAVRDAIGLASASTTLVVAIEDVHWADATTLDLLTYLTRSMQAERLLLIATARLDGLPRRHPLVGVLAELARLAWLERIDLVRFDAAEIAQQLTGILGRVPEASLAREVFERSDGNAFYAEELIATGASPGGPLPASLRAALSARLAGLDEATQQVLRVVAVAGRSVRHELLLQVAGLPAPQLVAAVRSALEQRVLIEVADPIAGYAFRHALVREAAYDELLAAERVALHAAVADAIERDASLSLSGRLARSGELAFHAMAAGDLRRALLASIDAAAAAEEASAFAEAELHLERIVEIWPRIDDREALVGTDRAGLLARLARTAASAGHQARGAAAAGEALEALPPDDDDRRVAILLERFEYAAEGADIDSAELAVAAALALVGDDVSARGAHAAAAEALLHMHRSRYAAGAAAAARAIEIARGCGATAELFMALTVQGEVQTQLGETNRAGESFAEAGGLYDDVGDPQLRSRWLRWRSWARFMHGAYAESLVLARQAIDLARRDGVDARLGATLLDAVLENLVELARWPEAAATAAEVFARVSMSFEFVYSHSTLARMHTFQGRFADAEREVAAAAAIDAVGPHRVWQLEDATFLAYASGRYAEGRARMEAAIASSSDPTVDATLWWSLVKAVGGEADRAVAARRRRRAAEAEEASAAGMRFATIFRASARRAIEADGGGPAVLAWRSTVEAELARLIGRSDADAWATVVAARAAVDQPWELAYARLRHGEAILAQGGPAGSAAAALRLAHEAATSLDAMALRSEIEAVAGRARIQLPPGQGRDAGQPPGPAGPRLTAREVSVIALVAAGHTNREIGDRLFISEKTVSVHVTHAMEKLGALSRYEAAASAERLGLLDVARTA
jgi:DNA-binding NarL/FixJ family response regulator